MAKNKEVKELEIKVSVSGAERARQSVERLNKSYLDAKKKMEEAEKKEAKKADALSRKANGTWNKGSRPNEKYRMNGIKRLAGQYRNERMETPEMKELNRLFEKRKAIPSHVLKKAKDVKTVSRIKAEMVRANQSMAKHRFLEKKKMLDSIMANISSDQIEQATHMGNLERNFELEKMRRNTSPGNRKEELRKLARERNAKRGMASNSDRMSLHGESRGRDNYKPTRDNIKNYYNNISEETKEVSKVRADANKTIKRVSAQNKSVDMGKANRALFDSVKGRIGSIFSLFQEAFGFVAMVAGSAMMVIGISATIIKGVLSIGDVFAEMESQVYSYLGFRKSMKDVAGFDKANRNNMSITGMDEYSSGAFLARYGTELRENGGSVNEKSLTALAVASKGSSYLTGKKQEESASAILRVAKEGKGADKIGLAGLKLTKNMNENLILIARGVSKDPVAGTLLRRGTIETGVNKIKGAPKTFIGKIMERSQEQLTRMWNYVGDNLMSVASDEEVIYKWRRVVTNLENMLKKVFNKENIKEVMLGAADWAAEIIDWSGKFFDKLSEMAKDKDKYIGYIKNGIEIFKWVIKTKLVFEGLRMIIDGGTWLSKLGKWVTGFKQANDVLQSTVGAYNVPGTGPTVPGPGGAPIPTNAPGNAKGVAQGMKMYVRNFIDKAKTIGKNAGPAIKNGATAVAAGAASLAATIMALPAWAIAALVAAVVAALVGAGYLYKKHKENKKEIDDLKPIPLEKQREMYKNISNDKEAQAYYESMEKAVKEGRMAGYHNMEHFRDKKNGYMDEVDGVKNKDRKEIDRVKNPTGQVIQVLGNVTIGNEISARDAMLEGI